MTVIKKALVMALVLLHNLGQSSGQAVKSSTAYKLFTFPETLDPGYIYGRGKYMDTNIKIMKSCTTPTKFSSYIATSLQYFSPNSLCDNELVPNDLINIRGNEEKYAFETSTELILWKIGGSPVTCNEVKRYTDPYSYSVIPDAFILWRKDIASIPKLVYENGVETSLSLASKRYEFVHLSNIESITITKVVGENFITIIKKDGSSITISLSAGVKMNDAYIHTYYATPYAWMCLDNGEVILLSLDSGTVTTLNIDNSGSPCIKLVGKRSDLPVFAHNERSYAGFDKDGNKNIKGTLPVGEKILDIYNDVFAYRIMTTKSLYNLCHPSCLTGCTGSLSGDCNPCHENCATCSSAPSVSSMNCDTCLPGFYLSLKDCLPCHRNCLTCSGYRSCLSCKPKTK